MGGCFTASNQQPAGFSIVHLLRPRLPRSSVGLSGHTTMEHISLLVYTKGGITQ